MGIGKTINALGDYNFYAKDWNEFTRLISSRFGINLQVYCVDMPSERTGTNTIEQFVDFGFHDTYKLVINFYHYDDNQPDVENTYCTYELSIPVDYPYKEELNLEFHPNGIFQLTSIPFNNSWHFFIEDIKGNNDQYYKSHEEVVEQIKVVRNSYVSILRKFDCSEAIIWTRAHYKTEDEFIFNQKPGKSNTLSDIKESIKDLDNITLYDFLKSVDEKSQFDNLSDLEIAFVDKFEDS